VVVEPKTREGLYALEGLRRVGTLGLRVGRSSEPDIEVDVAAIGLVSKVKVPAVSACDLRKPKVLIRVGFDAAGVGVRWFVEVAQ
jgi:hypothetical protein